MHFGKYKTLKIIHQQPEDELNTLLERRKYLDLLFEYTVVYYTKISSLHLKIISLIF